jgi:hypothetical protein
MPSLPDFVSNQGDVVLLTGVLHGNVLTNFVLMDFVCPAAYPLMSGSVSCHIERSAVDSSAADKLGFDGHVQFACDLTQVIEDHLAMACQD